jgi:NCS2 family nucleobase:cation symporter-2
VEAIVLHCRISGPVQLSVSFDEFDIDAAIAYDGVALELPDKPPTQDELLESDEGLRLMSGFLVRRQADKSASKIEKGATTLRLNFRH